MFCSKCGSQVNDGAAFCSVCGAKITSPDAADQPVQQARPQVGYTPPTRDETAAQYLPMKWFKFLIYFALWFGGIMNILGAFTYFTGSIYESAGVPAAIVYLAYPSLKTINIIYGLICFATGVLAIYTRFRLAAYAENGPKLLYLVYAITAIASLLYIVLNGSVIDDFSTVMPTAIANIVVSVLMIVLNRIYFNKRSYMFYN